MPSTLILDTSDPEVAQIVSQWQEGGRYHISLNITQGATTGSEVQFGVEEITDYGEAEPAQEEEMPDGKPPKMGGRPAAVMLLIGQKKAGPRPRAAKA